jgi:hypothetical protein
MPAEVGPGAVDQPATDDDGAGQRQPELHHQPAAFGAPAQLAVLVAPGMGALDHPPAARLDRCWDAPGGDLAHHPAFGQDLPTRLVVVAGIKVHHRLGGQRTDRTDGVQRRRQQAVIAMVGRAGSAANGMPAASVAMDRLTRCCIWSVRGVLKS